MKAKRNIRKKALLLFSALLLLTMGMAVTACSSEEEKGIPLWDESNPEEIVDLLVDAPAYVETVSPMPEDGLYTTVLYNLNADFLDAAIKSNDHTGVTRLFVKTAKLTENNIPFHSKVYITASVTNRSMINPDYAKKKFGIYDQGWAFIPRKTYLYKIRKRD